MRDDLQGATKDAPNATCSVCGGTGFKIVATPDAKGRTVQRATKCNCQLRNEYERRFEAAGIPNRYQDCSFSNYVSVGNLTAAKVVCEGYVREFSAVSGNSGLLLVGNIGTGKTHLAVAVIRGLIQEHGARCLFVDYRDLLKQIQNSYNSSVQATELEILRPVFETPVLVLDELGAIKPTEWVWDTVSLILNSRYNNRLPTIITTNFENRPSRMTEERKGTRSLSAEERARREETLGDRIGDRMWSRINEMCREVSMYGDDYRLRLKNATSLGRIGRRSAKEDSSV